MKKNLPIGVEDYSDAQRYYYVDKTLLIDEIISSMIGKSILITRPRRFGKSLVVSMLEYFFTIKEDYSILFKDKKIATIKESYKYLNKYPVIHLNMKNVNGNTHNEIIDKCLSEIAKLYDEYSFITGGNILSASDKEYFFNVLEKRYKDEYYYHDSIKKLSNYLSNYYHKKVVILIDEYDTPIEFSYEKKILDECIPFFKELYSNALKGNENVLFSFVTGVLEISKESLFSGLNNLTVYSVIDNKLNAYFGFTKEETIELLKEYEMDSHYDEIEKWYGGYEFGNRILFNPWSLLNYVERGQIRPYWINTGSNNLINELLYDHVKDEFLTLVNDNNKVIDFNNSINYRDFAYDNNSIYSYLVQAGYLIAKYVYAPKSYLIRIPNLEIYEVFKNDVIARGFNKNILNIATQLRYAIENAKIDEISKIIEEYVVQSFSYYDLKNEKNYQILLTGILAVLFDSYIVKTEVNSLNGRSDIMISPKKPNDIGIIFEVKFHKGKSPLSKAKLNESSASAIRQIEKNNYYSELIRRDCKKILLYGIAFDVNNNHSIDSKIVK